MKTTLRIEDPSLRDTAEIVTLLESDLERGLTASEAARRLTRDGPNELRTKPPIPAWKRLLAHLNNALVYLLLVAIGIAFAAWIIQGPEGWPVDALVIAAVVILNVVLGYAQESKANKAVAALAQFTAVTSSVMRDGQVQRIPSAGLVIGDLLVLAEGDAVGADARLGSCTDLRVQEAALTGESEAVHKDAARLEQAGAIADQINRVFKGTTVLQGSGHAVVTATGMDSEMGSIAALLDATAEKPTPLQTEVSRIGRVLAIAVVVIAIIVVLSILWMSDVRNAAGVMEVLLLGVSLAVAAVPEGLPAILSMVLALGVQRMAHHQAIVKNLSSVETLGSATVIASDKTGTLTRAEMTLVRILTASGDTEITGTGFSPEGKVQHEGAALTEGPLHQEIIVVICGGSLAGNARLTQEANSEWVIHGDPTEAAFLVAERKSGADQRRTKRFSRVLEIPFSSERKRMSTIELDHEHQDERVLICKGAPDVLLEYCTQVRVGMTTVALDDTQRTRILADITRLSDDALRTLAVAYRPLGADESTENPQSLERDLIYAGTVGIIDPPREEVAAAIADAHRAGIRVIMITGDHPRTAARIAADLKITAAGAAALSGQEIEPLDEAAFDNAIRETSIFARVSPAHKLRIVESLQRDHQIVAMTGDGVNDAPALKAADIGIAMGLTGTDVTREAARMILADDNFATIVQAVREGRGIFDNIRKFLRYLLTSNMGEVLTVFFGVIGAGLLGLTQADNGVVLPLLATQLLWINLVTDSGPALALGLDPPTEDLMARKPRPAHERVMDARLWWGVVLNGLVIALTALLTMDFYLPAGLMEGHETLRVARTASFTVLVFACLFSCFNARSETTSAFSGLLSSGWLWGAIALSLGLQVAVVHLPWLNLAFGTAPLSLSQWGVCAGMASGVLWFSELRKWVLRLRAS